MENLLFDVVVPVALGFAALRNAEELRVTHADEITESGDRLTHDAGFIRPGLIQNHPFETTALKIGYRRSAENEGKAVVKNDFLCALAVAVGREHCEERRAVLDDRPLAQLGVLFCNLLIVEGPEDSRVVA